MNLHLPQGQESESELRNLAAVPYQIVSPASNSTIIGIYQDSLLGSYQFTRQGIKFTPRDGMNLLMMNKNINIKTLLEKVEKNGYITNFDILSQIMPPLSLKYKMKAFKDGDDINTSNAVLEIRNGEYVRGQLDKSAFGAGTKGLLQRICNDFGNMASADFIDNLQDIITEYMKTSAFSVGISDLISDKKTNDAIVSVITSKKQEVKNLIDQVQLGIFENNTGKTNQEEFETQVNSILNQATSESGKIGLKSLGKDNRFVTMVNAGSKGSELNISFMISCLGQQNVDGKRIPNGFEHRTLPHYTKYDDSPGARGFVESSYINGLTPQELFFHAMGGRVGLIDTAVKSVTWETPIVIIENDLPKYIEIGKWIDSYLDNEENKYKIKHYTDRQMELLNVNNIYIPTTDANGNVTWGEITALTRHDPGNELFEIKTCGGRSVIVTESKSLLVWNKETEQFIEKYTPEIKVGDYVPVTCELCKPPIILENVDIFNYLPKTEFIYGTDFNKAIEMMENAMNDKIHIQDNWWMNNNGIEFTLPYTKKSSLKRTTVRSDINNIQNNYIYPYKKSRKDTKIPDKFELNECNGIFIGLFLAEGNANSSTVTITNNNKNIQNFVKNWFEKHNVHYKLRSRTNKIGGTTTTITGNSIVLAKFLNKFVGSGAKNKYVPNEAFISPEEFIIGLLNGYYSGDGTVSKNSIDVGSASKRLIEGISMLCSRLGIFGKISKSQLKKNNFNTINILPTYRLFIRANWAKIFADKIELLEETKNNKLKLLKCSQNHRNFKMHNNVILDEIREITKVDIKNYPKVYDLTIPSTLNFGLANGLQVRDTSTTGYIQRRLIKGLEDLKAEYDMTVRTNKNKIVQFSYGDDNIDPVKVENQSIPLVTMSTQEIYSHFIILEEGTKQKALTNIFLKPVVTRHKKQSTIFMSKMQEYIQFMIEMREKIIKNVFKNKGDSVVNCPVAFSYIINNIQGQCNISSSSLVDITPLEAFEMIEHYYKNLEKIHYAPPTQLFKVLYYFNLSPKDLLVVKRFNKATLTMLLDAITLYYKKSIISPGEMVGVIAGQSIGEVSTQMSVLSSEKIKIIVKNKKTNVVNLISTEIGPFIDNLMNQLPEYTFNTGHNVQSFETLLESLDEEYYIVGVTEDEKTQWNKISHVSRHPVNGDMMRVTTRSGRVIETTTSHSHLVRSDKTQTVVPIVGSDMKVGMRIPVANHIDNTFIKDTIQIENKFYKLDYLFGWFIGAYLSEGNINYNEICITNISDIFINNTREFAKIFNKEIRTNEKGEYGKSVTTKFTCKEIAKLLLNTCGTGSFIKRVPDFAFTAPNEFKSGLLQAYFDGEGNFQNDKNHHQIRVCSRSKQLIKDISLLLNYFDIFSSIKENFVRGSNIYNCYISSKYSIQYKNSIGSLLHINKLNELCDYIKREEFHKVPDYIDKINGIGNIIADCAKILKLPGQSRNYGYYKNKESIGRQTLEKYIQIFKIHPDSYKITRELNILQQAVTSNVVWDEIIDIQIYTPPQDIFVYDLTIPINQTFMTEYGVIIHNTLNTFHFAGVASKSNVTRGVPRIEEILSLSSEIKNPSLSIYLKPEDETQKEKAHSIMYMLEHTKLEEIVQSVEICFDPDDLNTFIEEDKETILQYKAFENMVAECTEASLQNDENEKSKWIIRMIMDPEVMLEKNITMDDVNFTLKNCYENQISCIYSDFNSDKLIFRIRMNEVLKSATGRGQKKIKVNPLDQSDQIYILKNFQDQLLQNIVLRGIKGINKVILRKIVDNVIENNGVYKKQEIWVLDTIGTNLLDVLALDFIDKTRTFSNDIVEIYDVLGIEAARQSIYNELVEVVEFDGTYINYHNYSVLVDRMTFTEKLISIFRHGINNDNIGPIAKASFEETPEMFLKAARHGELDTLKGISANVMCGQEGFYGTSAFQVIIDTDEYMKLDESEQYRVSNVNNDIEQMFAIENPNDSCSIDKIGIQTNIVTIKPIDMGKDDSYNPGF